ncbi:hypothetical protein RRG08_037526 [Elysia crispata]|uniref:Uncharacterized protein n=1 Tax=Elysia crispata TaxID=231223 RepID=A0AAE1A450_9GAST|nr:hypothetical protein RRG08_037526 [Elysia crispata]
MHSGWVMAMTKTCLSLVIEKLIKGHAQGNPGTKRHIHRLVSRKRNVTKLSIEQVDGREFTRSSPIQNSPLTQELDSNQRPTSAQIRSRVPYRATVPTPLPTEPLLGRSQCAYVQ